MGTPVHGMGPVPVEIIGISLAARQVVLTIGGVHQFLPLVAYCNFDGSVPRSIFDAETVAFELDGQGYYIASSDDLLLSTH